MTKSRRKSSDQSIGRRHVLQAAAAGVAGLAAGSRLRADDKTSPAESAEKAGGQVIQNGRIRQSVMGWCFQPMPALELARHCKQMGLVAIEGIDAEFFPAVKKMGLDVSLVGSHSFKQGMCDQSYHAECAKILKDRIDLAASQGYKRVITFTGFLPKGVAPEQAARNCVEGWKSVMSHAEAKGVTLVLEHLNTRDDTHPMKGHPGYFGDDVDLCVDIIRKVDSPSFKLLFDVYHVQIMNGDVIRRIGQYKDFIGHYHTAGNPGRGELDETQEINYPAVMRAILATGFDGYVAQEFIPTWDDPMAALRHAAKLCDV